MLAMSAEALAAVRAHAQDGYPLEVCGFLAGAVDGERRLAREAWPVRNAWEDDPEQRSRMFRGREDLGHVEADRWEAHSEERRFLVAPQDILMAMKRARAGGLELVGVYHTHPEHPAVPSDFDRDAAWPGWSYLILSVRDHHVVETRSWVIVEDVGLFEEEPVVSP